MAKKETRYVDVRVTSNIDKVTGKAQNNTNKLADGLKGVQAGAVAATGGIRAMTAALISSGVGAIVVALGSFVAMLGNAVNLSKDFAVGLSTLKAVASATDEQIEALSDNAKALGASTRYTAIQVVELQTEFARLGFSTNEILNVTEATLALASAAGTDLANAATIAGSTLRGFGLSTEETGRVADVMAKSFSSSSLDIRKFEESIKTVAPIAKTTKVSIEQATAALGVLSDRGISGGEAGTHLRKIMSKLAQATGKDFRTALEITNERLQAATSESEKLAIAQELVGDRAYGSLIALAENGEALDDLTLKLDGAEGAAAKMAETMEDNLQGDITKMKSAWEGLMLSIEDGDGVLTDIYRGAVTGLTKGIDFLSFQIGLLSSTWSVKWDNIKEATGDSVQRVKNMFGSMVNGMKSMGIGIKKALADVPLIGKAIDESKLKQDEALLKASQERIEKSNEGLDEKARQRQVRKFDAINDYLQKRKDALAKRDAERLKSQLDAFTEAEVTAEEDANKGKEEARKKFLDKLKRMQEDFEDQTELEKIERRRQRHLDELAQIEMEETEKQEVKKRINEYYDGLKKQQEEENEKVQAEKDEKDAEEKRLKRQKQHEEELAMKRQILDAAADAFGQESKMARIIHAIKLGLLIEEHVNKIKLAAQEMTMKGQGAAQDAGIAIAQAGVTQAQTGANVAKETAKNVGSPLKLAATIAAGAVAIASSIKAMRKTKQMASQLQTFGGGSAGAGGGSAIQAPSFNVIGSASAGENLIAETVSKAQEKPVKAYVVESELADKQKVMKAARQISVL